MTTPKKFTASSTESREAPTHPFELEGVYAAGRTGPGGATTWSETFTVTEHMGASQAQWFASAFVMLEGRKEINPPAVIEFLALACIPESRVRYRELIEDPDRLVDIGALAQVFIWLSEEVIQRPTAPAS